MAKQKKRKQVSQHRFVFISLILVIGAVCTIFVIQQNKLKEIAQEQTALSEEYQELQKETERIERIIEYAKSNEYLLQYAREKLGYVMPDDIKFYLDEQTE